MNDQNPIPPTEPVQPNIETAQPVIQTPPVVEVVLPLPDVPQAPEPFYKNRMFIIIAAVVILLILSTIGFFKLRSGSLSTVPNIYPNWTPYPASSYASSTYVPYTPQPEKVCNSPLAPAGAGPVSRCNYRDVKASVADAQAVMGRIYKNFGVSQIPDGLNFHEEIYKGIHIKWTDNQPVSATTMVWIKNAVDIMPSYFYIDHPVQAIYSATPEDLQVKGVAPEYLGAFAYASGLNIFLTKDFAQGSSTQYVVNKSVAIQALFHEWVHIIQMYDTLQTFTENYLSIPGNATVAQPIDPLTKDYAKTAGWVFQSDQYGDSEFATLGTDAASQKQSDYGKTKYVEDMAEAGSYFMLCQNDNISEARIKWWEGTTATSRNSYCPSKI